MGMYSAWRLLIRLKAALNLRKARNLKKSTSFLAIRKGSRTIFMNFNIAFELDSGLLFVAAAAEGAQ